MQEPRQFWMVYGDRQGPPIHQHDTLESAEAEAKRLARLAPDVHFFVLEAVFVVVKREFVTVSFRKDIDDEIPF